LSEIKVLVHSLYSLAIKHLVAVKGSSKLSEIKVLILSLLVHSMFELSRNQKIGA